MTSTAGERAAAQHVSKVAATGNDRWNGCREAANELEQQTARERLRAPPESPGPGPAEIDCPESDLQTLLVVDDEESILWSMRRALERNGFRVLTASDGREGVEVFLRHAEEIVAVLLDVNMPVMRGPDAWRAIRQIRDDALVFLVTGEPYDEVAASLPDLERAMFLQKPLRIDVFVERLRAVLAIAAAASEPRAHAARHEPAPARVATAAVPTSACPPQPPESTTT